MADRKEGNLELQPYEPERGLAETTAAKVISRRTCRIDQWEAESIRLFPLVARAEELDTLLEWETQALSIEIDDMKDRAIYIEEGAIMSPLPVDTDGYDPAKLPEYLEASGTTYVFTGADVDRNKVFTPGSERPVFGHGRILDVATEGRFAALIIGLHDGQVLQHHIISGDYYVGEKMPGTKELLAGEGHVDS